MGEYRECKKKVVPKELFIGIITNYYTINYTDHDIF